MTSGEDVRNKRAIPALAIIQGVAAIGGMMIKGINALVDAERASLFNNAIKLINKNVQITHNSLITQENRTAMMAKTIIPVLKDFKQQINNTNNRFERQYQMMTKSHDIYNYLDKLMQTAFFLLFKLCKEPFFCKLLFLVFMQDAPCLVCWFSRSFVSKACACFWGMFVRGCARQDLC